jgi:hypothetical protein
MELSIIFPGTLLRTWGTRPTSWNFVDVSSYVDREPVLVVKKKSENRTSGAKSLSDRALYGRADLSRRAVEAVPFVQ